MLTPIAILRQSRVNFLNLIKDYDTATLNRIPQGFSNNLIWNFGHLLVTQQLLAYKLSNLPMHYPDAFIDRFRKGTAPQEPVSAQEVEWMKEWALKSVDQMESDLAAGLFKEYTPYPTSFGISLNSIEDALAFINTHEGLHLGYAMALRKNL
ncbi:DinB family protein [Cytophagales bacterium LB-30]|uniref:DinB family protein n=1 Tax=Shiella aurantiaca TaxID=3058365 RepID=A0ABT8F3N5_9BACT|nr:DinB family protein [Shiella aurantiaca]MDN4165073.1 DinB family protein [Shiella aurantiaca]